MDRCGMYHHNKKSWLGLISGRHVGRKKGLANDMHSPKLNFRRNRERRKNLIQKKKKQHVPVLALHFLERTMIGWVVDGE